MEIMFWLDMEMSGLDVNKERILETAVIVTDLQLNVLEQYESSVFQSQEVLNNMDQWCTEHHSKSGLTARVPNGIKEEDLDVLLSQLGKKYCPKGKIVLCGNSIAQDRKFIDAYLPKFSAMLHYRMLDVSSIKLVFENVFDVKFKKQNKHRALDDIFESISEYAFYLQFLDASKLKKPVPVFSRPSQ